MSGKDLVHNLQGYAYNQIIFNQHGEANDFVFLHVDTALAGQMGLEKVDLEGKKASEVFPQLKKGDNGLLHDLQEILKTGGKLNVKGVAGQPGKDFALAVNPGENGKFEMYFQGNSNPIQEKEALEKLLKLTEEFIRNSEEKLNFQKIADSLRDLVGAKFVLLNLYNDARDCFKTAAVSARRKSELEIAEKITGKSIRGQEWPSPPERVRKLKRDNLTCFSGLGEKLCGTILEDTGRKLDRELNLGQVGAIEIASPGKALANLMVIMDRGEEIGNREIVELFSGHLELLMERERAEQALKQSEEKFRLIFDHAPSGLFHFNHSGKITACNQNFLDIFSLNREDVDKINVFKLSEKFGGEKIGEILEGKLRTFKGSYFSRKRNREVAFRALLAPLYSREEKIGGAMGIVEDISFRVVAEKALQKREAKLQSILQTAPVGIGVDRNRVIQEANGYLASITGFTIGEMLDRDVCFLYTSREEYEKVGNEKRRQMEETGKAKLETTWKKKDGQTINVLLNCTYLNPENPEEGITFIAIDITQRKKDEQRLNFLSFHDSLTGLNNRAFLEEKIEKIDPQKDLPLSVIMADINGLKMINDAYGHKVGDQLLKKAAELMKNSCPAGGFLARWGGDEFMFLLPRTAHHEAELIALEVRGKCTGEKIQEAPLSLSLGISSREKTSQDIREVLKEAEDQMYQRKLAESRSVRSSVLSAILKTLGLKSDETEEHALRMQKLALELGERIKLPQSERDRLLLLVSLHDIGKISIGEDILRKPGTLNMEEWEIVKKHPEIGYRLAISTGEFAHIAEEILSHHEYWDGGGYPRGLKGENIPLLARIIAIIDAFDVMTNGRPYKEPMSEDMAMQELQRCAGTQFDPYLVQIFVDMKRNRPYEIPANYNFQGGF